MNKLSFSSCVCIFDLVIPVFAENELVKLIKLNAATTERIRSFISFGCWIVCSVRTVYYRLKLEQEE